MNKFWILHKQPFRDKSVIANLLTDKDERRKAILRTNKSVPSIGEFEPFIGFLKGSELLSVTKLESLGGRYFLRENSLISGLYVNELIVYLIPDGTSSQGLFELYKATIQGLLESYVGPVLRNFEKELLGHLGIYPDLLTDFSGNPICPKLFYVLQNEETLVPVIEKNQTCLPGSIWMKIGEGAFESKEINRYGKILHRKLLNRALGGRKLYARSLLQNK